VTYVGTVPDPVLSRGIADWIVKTSIPANEWRQARPPSVTSTSASGAGGSVVHFVHNWSWDPVEMTVPVPARGLLSGAAFDAGEPLRLGPWDVQVLVERRARGE
jgi:beta-galactosidase